MNSRLQKIKTYFNHSHHYLSQTYDIRFRAHLIKKITGDLTHASILDLGCGDGSLSLQFQSDTNQITLVDISETMLTIADSRIDPAFKKNIQLVRSSIESFACGERFDLVIASGVIAHAASIDRVVATISRLMAPSGRAVIQLTDNDRPVSKMLSLYNDLLDGVTRRFTYKRNKITLTELLKIAKRHHLFPVEAYRYSLMLPGMNTFIPDRLLYAFHEWTYRNTYLNRLSTDIIMTFSKRTTLI